MHEWTTVANELRAARKAREEFVLRTLIEQSIIGPLLLDRLAADLGIFGECQRKAAGLSLQSTRWKTDD